MKVFIINSFRSMVYVAFLAIIVFGGVYGYFFGALNEEMISSELGLAPAAIVPLCVVLGVFAGWIAASLVCGLIVTVLDIRDDINDRLPDARDD